MSSWCIHTHKIIYMYVCMYVFFSPAVLWHVCLDHFLNAMSHRARPAASDRGERRDTSEWTRAYDSSWASFIDCQSCMLLGSFQHSVIAALFVVVVLVDRQDRIAERSLSTTRRRRGTNASRARKTARPMTMMMMMMMMMIRSP